MTKRNQEAVQTLNHLIGVCVDAERSFRLAAEREDDAQLKSLFSRYADERAEFSEELQSEVTRMGGLPAREGSAVAASRRVWAAAKANVTGSAAAIVAECEKEEDTATQAYEEALDRSALSPQLQKIVLRQYAKVKEAHDRVRELRDEKEEADRAGQGPWDGEAFADDEEVESSWQK